MDGTTDMARFIAYDIAWDLEADDPDQPDHVLVWLPGYVSNPVPADDVEAVTDKLSDDFGFCIKSLKVLSLP